MIDPPIIRKAGDAANEAPRQDGQVGDAAPELGQGIDGPLAPPFEEAIGDPLMPSM